tara:strand:- start:423 stop:707 length:285 start_codon:yes stop_codon:yes gene_type:complete
MAEQTVSEVLTAATDSVTLINDINTNGKKSTYVGGSAEADTEMEQSDINDVVQRNVDHLEIILEYTDPDVKGSSDDKSSYTGAITTGKAYIAAN